MLNTNNPAFAKQKYNGINVHSYNKNANGALHNPNNNDTSGPATAIVNSFCHSRGKLSNNAAPPNGVNSTDLQSIPYLRAQMICPNSCGITANNAINVKQNSPHPPNSNINNKNR